MWIHTVDGQRVHLNHIVCYNIHWTGSMYRIGVLLTNSSISLGEYRTRERAEQCLLELEKAIDENIVERYFIPGYVED